MKRNSEEKKLILKVCKLYYFDSWTQEKIAAKFGISRPVISKLLQKARDEGLVEIVIHDETSETDRLEEHIEKAFNLRRVHVVPTSDMNNNNLIYSAVGRVAASFILGMIKNAERIGVSWGNTLYHVVKEFPYEKKENIKVIPMVGGMGCSRIEIHSNQIAYELSKKLGGQCVSLYAPAVVETEEQRDKFIQLPRISSILEEGNLVDLALVGIGNPFALSTMEEIGYIDQDVLGELKSIHAVADINSQFIDQNGATCDHLIHNKIIGVNLEQLKKVKNVIGIAIGSYKVNSILAALKGGFLDVLITDEITALALVNRMNKQ